MAKLLIHNDDRDQINEYLANRAVHHAQAKMAGQWLSIFIFAGGILTDLYITPDFFPEYRGYPFIGGFVIGILIRILSGAHSNYVKM